MAEQTVLDVAFDSNVLTFFLDANRGQYELVSGDPLRPQRIAAYRLFLFCRPFIVRTVASEAERITNDDKLREHMQFISYQFGECIPDEAQVRAIERRASELEPFHPGKLNDCRILAEVELCQLPLVVTFDTDFQKRLSTHTKVRIQTPAECWQSFSIPPGARPQWVPARGHPLANETWWRW